MREINLSPTGGVADTAPMRSGPGENRIVPRHLNVLLVENNPRHAALIQDHMADTASVEFHLSRVDRLSSAISYLKERGAQLAIVTLDLPDSSGIDTARQFRKAVPWIPMVALTDDDDESIGLAALNAGAQDYLTKGQVSGELLARVARYALERHAVQQELLESKQRIKENFAASEARMRLVLDTSPNCVSIKDHNGRYLLANKTLADLFGTTSQEMLGHTDLDLFTTLGLDSRDALESMQADQGVINTGQTLKIGEQAFKQSDGSVRWWSTIKAPISFPGDHHCLLEIAVDVNEAHMAKEALRNSELRLRTILDAQTSNVILMDPEMKVLWANQAACETARLKREEMIGQSCYHSLHRRESVCPNCPAQAAITEGIPKVRQIRSSNGRICRVQGIPVRNDAGHLASVVSVVEDITERISMEAQLRQAQKMESLGTLAGGIAHDFNNILSAIIGYTELALGQSTDDPSLKGYLRAVYQAGVRATDLVRQILTFSRRGEAELRPLRIDLILKEALKLLRSTLPSTIDIVQKIPTDLGLILADATQIHQIIMNLCTNAAHAMASKGGELTVSLSQESLDTDFFRRAIDLKSGLYLRLSVSDTGCGMTPEIMAAIFDPYFTTKDLGEGTGLGLAVVHGIIKDCGGDIRVQSEVGRGSRFDLYFPIVEAQARADGKDEEVVPLGGTERILSVDDEPPILKVNAKILGSLGYQVTSVGDSQQALSLFQADPTAFDLILTDMTMPKLTGDQLAEAILSIRPDIPIILCTGYSNDLDEEKVQAMGIRALVMKPVGRQKLAGEVRRILGAKVSGPESIDPQ